MAFARGKGGASRVRRGIAKAACAASGEASGPPRNATHCQRFQALKDFWAGGSRRNRRVCLRDGRFCRAQSGKNKRGSSALLSGGAKSVAVPNSPNRVPSAYGRTMNRAGAGVNRKNEIPGDACPICPARACRRGLPQTPRRAVWAPPGAPGAAGAGLALHVGFPGRREGPAGARDRVSCRPSPAGSRRAPGPATGAESPNRHAVGVRRLCATPAAVNARADRAALGAANRPSPGVQPRGRRGSPSRQLALGPVCARANPCPQGADPRCGKPCFALSSGPGKVQEGPRRT